MTKEGMSATALDFIQQCPLVVHINYCCKILKTFNVSELKELFSIITILLNNVSLNTLLESYSSDRGTSLNHNILKLWI